MSTYYLKFESKQKAIQLLASNQPELFWLDNGIPHVRGNHNFAIDLVGDVYHHTGVMLKDEYDNEYPEMVLVPGYHVNVAIKGDLPEYLKPFEVFPVTPQQTFGG